MKGLDPTPSHAHPPNVLWMKCVNPSCKLTLAKSLDRTASPQLAGVFIELFSHSLTLSLVPACFKIYNIVFICFPLPATLGPLQFAYLQNRSAVKP